MLNLFFNKTRLIHKQRDIWTDYEDARLKFLLNQQKYGYAELSQMLHRSAGAIQRRCVDLKIKDRPVKAENHGEQAAWTNEMFCILSEGIKAGDNYMAISKRIGKSEKAIRGKVYAVYLTENMDKVRKMLNGGEWGSGKPVPTVKQSIHLSGHIRECIIIRTKTANCLWDYKPLLVNQQVKFLL